MISRKSSNVTRKYSKKFKANIIFFIPTLEVGGAEKVCINHVNYSKEINPILVLQEKRGPLLSELRKDIDIIDIRSTIIASKKDQYSSSSLIERLKRHLKKESSSSPCFYCPVIKILNSGLIIIHKIFLVFYNKVISKIFSPIIYLASINKQAKQLIEIAEENDSQIINSYITSMNLIALTAKKISSNRISVIINVHDTTSEFLNLFYKNKLKLTFIKLLIKRLYPFADCVIAINKGVREDLIKKFKIKPEKIKTIYNPIDIEKIKSLSLVKVIQQSGWFDHGCYKIIAVGRLIDVKGFDFLIKAVSLIKTFEPRLLIIGEGVERNNLENLIIENELSNKVFLHGFSNNPWKYMHAADVLVLSSISEGSPNVIGEAMILGLPIIATTCSLGVVEMLENGQNGMLIKPKDINALREGIEKLYFNKSMQLIYKKKAKTYSSKFDKRLIVPKYENILLHYSN